MAPDSNRADNVRAALDNSFLHLAVFLGLFFYRRPDQFRHPGLWNEDGEQIIVNLERLGLWGLFEPVNGYMILSSTTVNYISSRLSFDYYPELSAALTILITFALIKRLSMLLDAPFAFYLFLAVFLLYPADSEVLGVGLYTFWVFGLYATAVFYVQIAKPHTVIPSLDVVLLVIAMLSGPFGVISFGLWAMVQCHRFDRRLWFIAAVLAIASASRFLPTGLPPRGSCFVGGGAWYGTGSADIPPV